MKGGTLAEAPAVLARPGIAPAVASRAVPGTTRGDRGPHPLAHRLRASGPTPAAVLGRLLAKALERGS